MSYAKLEAEDLIAEGDDRSSEGSTGAPTMSQAILRMETLRTKRINWQTYFKTAIVEEDEYRFLQEYSTKTSSRNELILKQPTQCAKTFLGVPQKIRTDETVQCLLTMFYDLLKENKERLSIFHKYAADVGFPVYQPLMSLLGRPSPFTASVSSHIIGFLVSSSNQLMTEDDLRTYFEFIREQLSPIGQNNEFLLTIISSLQLVLRGDHYRKAFVANHCLEGLAKLLRLPRLNFQLQYQLIFCIWLLAFNAGIASTLNRYGIVVTLSDILKRSIKIKVQRICVAALRNLAEKPENAGENCQGMIQQRVPQVLKVLAGRNWEDEDVQADLQFLQETLSSSLQDLTSYDEYVTEVKSGRLEWSPAHKSDKFWRENIMRFNDRGHEMIILLFQLLGEAPDAQTLAIASHDIGQYVRYYPRGKDYIERTGVKERIMQLLNHHESDVKYEALVATQKMMVHNWEYLGKQLEVA
eukprot:m.2631 g.2631  ORF g.2631 m.2631 type:complete len:468 (+) comp8806_c0_seq1:82-1485(+)